MKIQESAEMYLETIHVLSQQKEKVHSIDVATSLKFSKPSVSRAVKNLKENGYLIMKEDDSLVLTDKGLEIAEKIYERHQLLSDFFILIGVNEESAIQDACKIEHDLSIETFSALKKHILEFKQNLSK